MITDFIADTANVYGIYGHLGGGKSLTAVEIAVWALRKGWTVVSNIELFHVEHFSGQYVFLRDLDGVDFWQLPCGAPRGSPDPFRVCIVIDECAEFFDQFSSRSPVLTAFLSWLRHSSKRGQNVFLIVQQPEFIAKSLRLLVNKWICCVDMAQFRLPMLRLKIPFTSHLVWRRMIDKYGNLISRGFNMADKMMIGYYYNTAQSIATAGRGVDYRSNYSAPIPSLFGFFLLIFIFVLLMILWC